MLIHYSLSIGVALLTCIRNEHKRRSPDCQFFTLVEAAKMKGKKPKESKRQSSRPSRASRLSTQSTTANTIDLEVSTLLDNADAEEGDTVLSVTGVKRKAPKTRTRANTGTRSTKAAQKTGRNQLSSLTDDLEHVMHNASSIADNQMLSSATHELHDEPKRKRATKASHLEVSKLPSSTTVPTSPLTATETYSLPKRLHRKEQRSNRGVTQKSVRMQRGWTLSLTLVQCSTLDTFAPKALHVVRRLSTTEACWTVQLWLSTMLQ